MKAIDYNATGKWFTITFPFEDQDMAARVAEIPGSKWYKPGGYWIVPKQSGTHVWEWALMNSPATTAAADAAMNWAMRAEDRFKKSSAKDPEYPDATYGVAIDLYDYQKAGLEYILHADKGNSKVIVGDEMGTGKTFMAIAAVHSLQAYPAVIVVPRSLRVNWKREIMKAVPGASVEIMRGRSAHPRLFHADWTIINYDIVDAWEHCLPAEPLAVIADESHMIMNPNVTRTQATLRVFESAHPEALKLCMSGTSVLNKTNEIMTQLEAVGRLPEVQGQSWKGKGRELNRLMRSEGMYLRRLKVDVWKDAPERKWAPFTVEGDEKAMKEYRKAEANIVKWLAEKAKAAAREAGATTKEAQAAAWAAMWKAQSAEILIMFTYLKQLAAHAKMPAVRDWVDSFMAQPGEKLAAFTWHREVLEELTQSMPKLNPLTIQGGQSDRHRQAAVDLFQNDPKHRLLVGQIKAAGVGLTLTAASNVLLVEMGWTPGAHDQVLDRCHRRGQTNDVVGWVPICQGTIDEDIYQLVNAKREVVDGTLDGYDRTSDETVEASVVEELAARFHLKGIDAGPGKE